MMIEISRQFNLYDPQIIRWIISECSYILYGSGTDKDKCLILFKKLIEDYGINIHFDGEYLLQTACDIAYIPLVRYFLEQGADVTKISLYWLVRYRHLDIIELLFEYGFNLLDQADTILFAAIDNGNPKLVDFLIKNGAILKPRLLTEAVHHNNIACVRLLIEHGIDIRHNSDEAIKDAIFHRYHDIVDLLLEHGAKIDFINSINSDNPEIEQYMVYD
jgi:ankyrin repeat protein